MTLRNTTEERTRSLSESGSDTSFILNPGDQTLVYVNSNSNNKTFVLFPLRINNLQFWGVRRRRRVNSLSIVGPNIGNPSFYLPKSVPLNLSNSLFFFWFIWLQSARGCYRVGLVGCRLQEFQSTCNLKVPGKLLEIRVRHRVRLSYTLRPLFWVYRY